MHIVAEDLPRAFYKLLFLRFYVSSDQWEHSVAKMWQGIWERFLYGNNSNYNSYKFNHEFAFIPSLSFRRNQKQEAKFQQVGGLVTRNISVSCLQRVALYFKGMPNSIDFHKKIFLHVIPARIIVPWYGCESINLKVIAEWNKLFEIEDIY